MVFLRSSVTIRPRGTQALLGSLRRLDHGALPHLQAVEAVETGPTTQRLANTHLREQSFWTDWGPADLTDPDPADQRDPAFRLHCCVGASGNFVVKGWSKVFFRRCFSHLLLLTFARRSGRGVLEPEQEQALRQGEHRFSSVAG